MSDKEIILLLQSSPADGLYEAMNQYHALVRAIVSRILPRNPQDAEECVEDTFVNVWRFIGGVDPDTKTFRGLLMSTARNLAITRYRQLRRRQVVPLEEALLFQEDDIAETVAGADATRQLQQLILELEEPDREIFFRKYFLFESLKEISGRVGLDQTQIRNRLYRGRQRLKKRLEERGITNEAI